MTVRRFAMALLLALTALAPQGAVASPQPQHSEHHAPAPAQDDASDCAAACIGCSVETRLPAIPTRIVLAPQGVTSGLVVASLAGLVGGLDPPPPRLTV